MHGNVWEWCLDYSGESLGGMDPVGASSGSCREARGGGWKSAASTCTSSFHTTADVPSNSNDNVGFRLARTLSE